jgi:molybdopterin synthase sulfur carrier subunit
MSEITVKIKLFAAYQQAYKTEELTLTFPKNITVENILDDLLTGKPELEKWRNLTRFGVNLNFVEPDTFVNDGDEIVLIPPVSGG